MQAIILDKPGQFSLVEVNPPDQLGLNEALVRVRRVGICGTDLHAFEGKQPFFSYPRILGHELAVEIVALGPCDHENSLVVGDQCVVEPYLNCGTCLACRRGRTNCCARMQVLGVHRDGGMREWFTVPINKLHRANEISVENRALVEMLSIGAHAVRRSELETGENVLIIGAGPIGMGAMQFAQMMGANVIAMDISPGRLEFARQHAGAGAIVDARQDAEHQLRDLLNGNLPTTVFDATGSTKSMMNAFQYVEHSGQLVFVGLVQDNISFHDPLFHSREMTLLATRNATSADFSWVIDSMVSGQVDLTSWITHRATPEGLLEQFASWLQPETGVIKAMLTFDE